MPLSTHVEKQRWHLLAELVHTLLFQQAAVILAALLPALHSYILFPAHGNKLVSFQDNKQVAATDNSKTQCASALGDTQCLLCV